MLLFNQPSASMLTRSHWGGTRAKFIYAQGGKIHRENSSEEADVGVELVLLTFGRYLDRPISSLT